MPHYEYTTEVLTHGFLGRKEEELDRQEFQERLNALGAELLAREVLLGQQRVLARALDDAQEVGHRRDLLDLLLDEPLHELLRRVVALLARDAGQRVDLLGDALLLLER